MDFTQVFYRLGFFHKEPEIYITLLKLPGAQPASVIARKLNMNRTTVYKSLMSLSKKGLVTKTKRHGITCFFAENPESSLKQLIEGKKKQLEEINQTILDALPLMMRGSQDIQAVIPKIRYYEGIEGIKMIYEHILEEGKDVYRYGDITKIYEALGYFTDDYIKKRIEKGLTTYAIEPYAGTEAEAALKKHAKEHRKVLFIPHKKFPIEGEIRIFGHHVAIISLHKESPIGVIIESQTIAKMFYSIFMLTWEEHGQKKAERPTQPRPIKQK